MPLSYGVNKEKQTLKNADIFSNLKICTELPYFPDHKIGGNCQYRPFLSGNREKIKDFKADVRVG